MHNQVKFILVSFSAVLLLVAGTVVGTNFVTADAAPGAGTVTVTFNYNGATGGNTVASDTVTPGSQADDFLPLPTKTGESFTGWFNTQSLLNGQRITTVKESDAGELLAGFVPPELAQTLNLDLPAATSCAEGGTCVLGNIGPGGGLVFLIAGSTRYEMAPKNWYEPANPSAVDPLIAWITSDATCFAAGLTTPNQNCQSNSLYPETTIGAQNASRAAASAVGMGSANTAAIKARMLGVNATLYAAGSASAYRGGGKADWFLPSKDELNAMCNYSRTWVGSPSTGICTGGQNAAFESGLYGFAVPSTPRYRSSSEGNSGNAWTQTFNAFDLRPAGEQSGDGKASALRIRPIRSF